MTEQKASRFSLECALDNLKATYTEGLRAILEDMQTETKTTTTVIPYLDQPGRLAINWEGVLKKMKELAWAADGLRARCMDCQTNKNKATKHIDNWCTACNVTLWNCAEWRRDQDQGGESISKYFSEHPISQPSESTSSWMKQYYERCVKRWMEEAAINHECEQAVWKDMKAAYKVKATLNTPGPVAPPAAPKNWEFSEGCEGRRTIAYLLV
jgi:hypothetical protein